MFDIGTTLTASFNSAFYGVVNFFPKFLVGLVVLIIGIIIASILKQVVVGAFKALKVDVYLKKYAVPGAKEGYVWINLLAEIVRWFVIIVFLVPTAEVWGLPQIIAILNEFLMYLPNVFVAAVIAMIGFVLAKLAHDLLLASMKGVDNQTAVTVASITRWVINVFVVLVVLNQLGVAADLIRILFTGIVAMLAVAGGIAFGLGGQGAAQEVIEGIKKRLIKV
jgi:small-conductance mechanosensitive channel